jgi:hypothetical protein
MSSTVVVSPTDAPIITVTPQGTVEITVGYAPASTPEGPTNPMTAKNDIIVGGVDGIQEREAIGINDIVGRNGSGDISGIKASDLTSSSTIGSLDFVLAWNNDVLRKFPLSTIPAIAAAGITVQRADVPLLVSDPGNAGDIAVDASYLYVFHFQGGSWGRVALDFGW